MNQQSNMEKCHLTGMSFGVAHTKFNCHKKSFYSTKIFIVLHMLNYIKVANKNDYNGHHPGHKYSCTLSTVWTDRPNKNEKKKKKL